jgi:hypothetical protein
MLATMALSIHCVGETKLSIRDILVPEKKNTFGGSIYLAAMHTCVTKIIINLSCISCDK